LRAKWHKPVSQENLILRIKSRKYPIKRKLTDTVVQNLSLSLPRKIKMLIPKRSVAPKLLPKKKLVFIGDSYSKCIITKKNLETRGISGANTKNMLEKLVTADAVLPHSSKTEKIGMYLYSINYTASVNFGISSASL
jgi:hypothetical protein